MRYIEAVENYEPKDGEISLFLAGGISNCRDWQTEMTKLLEDLDIVIMNPRRKNYNLLNSALAEEQIKWEYDYLAKSTMISFWFSPETLCPITLFEYGKYIGKEIFNSAMEFEYSKKLENLTICYVKFENGQYEEYEV